MKKTKFDLQLFATPPTNPEANLTTMDGLGTIKSIDFVNRFNYSIQELLEVLAVTRRLPLAQDQKITTYKFTTTKPSTTAGEGEIIPLTKVERKKDKEYEVPLNKYRKVTTAEAIRRHGFSASVNDTDNEMLSVIQQDVKADFFTFLATAPTKQSAATLQMALSTGWAKARNFFKNKGNVTYVSFVNSMDVAKFLGEGTIQVSSSTQYGFTLLKDYLNQNVIVFDDIPEGKVYTTAVENIVFAYQDVASSELANAFDLITDPSNLIGTSHSVNKQNATVETLAMNGSTLFAEILDGVVETSIVETP